MIHEDILWAGRGVGALVWKKKSLTRFLSNICTSCPGVSRKTHGCTLPSIGTNTSYAPIPCVIPPASEAATCKYLAIKLKLNNMYDKPPPIAQNSNNIQISYKIKHDK